MVRPAAVLLSAVLLSPGPAAAQAPVRGGSALARQGFHLESYFPAQVLVLPDSIRLVYELHLTNYAQTPLTLRRVQVLDAESGSPLLSLDEALGNAMQPVGPLAGTEVRRVEPGRQVVIYLGVAVRTVPRRLRHRIFFEPADETGKEVVVEGGATLVGERNSPRLAPPLRGGPWVTVYDPALERGHRRVLYAVAGRARIPGRFAVDFMRPIGVGPDSSAGEGAQVLAVADAIVAAVRDDVPEPDSAGRKRPVTIGDAAGNYIALDLGGGTYAFYEHLKPGIPVRPGDQVRKGQVIGALGSTGQAPIPHLHFHVSNALSTLDAEGLPFTMEGMKILGGYSSLEEFGRGGPWETAPWAGMALPKAFFPPPNLVVAFP